MSELTADIATGYIEDDNEEEIPESHLKQMLFNLKNNSKIRLVYLVLTSIFSWVLRNPILILGLATFWHTTHISEQTEQFREREEHRRLTEIEENESAYFREKIDLAVKVNYWANNKGSVFNQKLTEKENTIVSLEQYSIYAPQSFSRNRDSLFISLYDIHQKYPKRMNINDTLFLSDFGMADHPDESERLRKFAYQLALKNKNLNIVESATAKGYYASDIFRGTDEKAGNTKLADQITDQAVEDIKYSRYPVINDIKLTLLYWRASDYFREKDYRMCLEYSNRAILQMKYMNDNKKPYSGEALLSSINNIADACKKQNV
jgi:hypothetical protein